MMALEIFGEALARPPSSAGIARYNNRANSYYYVYRERLDDGNGHRQRSYVSDGDAEHIARHESSRIVRRSQSVQLIDMFQSISTIYRPRASYIEMGTLRLEKRNRKCGYVDILVLESVFPQECHPEPRGFCGVKDLLFALG